MNLRPYQAEARDAILREWDVQGHKHTLAVLPTGSGKTIIFSKVAEDRVQRRDRVLIMAHRDELLQQASDKLYKTSKLETSFEKASSSCLNSSAPIVIGSVQSLMQPGRLRKFPADYFDDIIVDEAHHCLSDSYQRVLTHFPDANVLGVTATPDRGDMQNLGEYFDSLAYEYTLQQGIRDGYLCKIQAQMIPLSLDISNVHISQGDFAVNDIGNALEPYLDQIADEMVHYCQGRKTVVFLPLIAISQEFCDILRNRGFRAAEVNGNSPDRKEILEDFENGVYDVLCNAMLLTEGWDCPSVDCIVVLRPTKIRALYAQMVGRGMRLASGKENLLLLDFLWHSERHNLCHPTSLVCQNANEADAAINIIANSDSPVDIIDAENQAKIGIVAKREQALAEELKSMRGKKRKLIDPLQYSISINELDIADYVPTFRWEKDAPTKLQLETLEKFNISSDEIKSKGEAAKIIATLCERANKGLATPKQIKKLEEFGFTHVGEWPKTAAAKMLSRIAAVDWRYAPVNVEKYDWRRDCD